MRFILIEEFLTPEEVAISRFGGNKWSMNTEIDMEMRERMSEDPEDT